MINHMEQYDFILLLIPLALLIGTGTFTGLGIPFETAVTVGSTVSGLIVAHAIFVSPPVGNGRDAV